MSQLTLEKLIILKRNLSSKFILKLHAQTAQDMLTLQIALHCIAFFSKFYNVYMHVSHLLVISTMYASTCLCILEIKLFNFYIS